MFDWALVAYWVCFGVGTVYAFVSAILGGIFGLFDGGGDGGIGGGGDIGHDYGAGDVVGYGEAFATELEAGPALSPLSPVTISVFLATFGGVGIILTSLANYGLLISLPISALAGVTVTGLVMLLFYHLFTKVQGTSEARQADAIGLTAEITVPISSEGVGEVAYVLRGSRLVASARSATGVNISRHTAVRIVSRVGNTLYVEPVGSIVHDAQPLPDDDKLRD